MINIIVKRLLRPTGWMTVTIIAICTESLIASIPHSDLSNSTVRAAPISTLMRPLAPKFVRSTQQSWQTAEHKSEQILLANLNDTSDYWSKRYINSLAEANIINGFPDGTFRPSESITRAQFAAIVTKAFNLNMNGSLQPFRDRELFPSWATQSIDATARVGLISGFPDGTFRPNQALTRAEAITILIKASEANPVKLSEVESILSSFSDNSAIPDWARQSTATATKDHLIVLYPESKVLNPNTLAARGDVAALTYLALAKKGIVPELSVPPGAEIPKVGSIRPTSETTNGTSWWSVITTSITTFPGILNSLGAVIGALGGSSGVLALFNFFRNSRQAPNPVPNQTLNQNSNLNQRVSLGWMMALTFLGFWLALVSIINLFTLRPRPSLASSNQPSEETALLSQLQTLQTELTARNQTLESQLSQIQQTTTNLETGLQRVEARFDSEASGTAPQPISQPPVSNNSGGILPEATQSNPTTTNLFTPKIKQMLITLGLGLLFGALGGLFLALPTVASSGTSQASDLQVYSPLKYLLFSASLGSITGVLSMLALVFILNIDAVLFLVLASFMNGLIASFVVGGNPTDR